LRAPSARSTCRATRGIKVFNGPDWLHKIEHDGYREASSVKASASGCSRGAAAAGRTVTPKLPGRAEATQDIVRYRGEAVLLCPDGISDFPERATAKFRLYAFDPLQEDSVDIRAETLQIRKLWLGSEAINQHEAGESALPCQAGV